MFLAIYIAHLLLLHISCQVDELDFSFISHLKFRHGADERSDTTLAPSSTSQKPHVILFYYNFGAIYQRLKPYWIDITNEYRSHFNFGQIEVHRDKQSKKLFAPWKIPVLVYFQGDTYYSEDNIQKPDDIRNFLNGGWANKEPQKIPSVGLLHQLENLFFTYPNNQILSALLIASMLIGLVHFRLSIYKDLPEGNFIRINEVKQVDNIINI